MKSHSVGREAMRLLLCTVVFTLATCVPPARAAVIAGGSYDHFELITTEDISQSGALQVSGEATIEGAAVTLDRDNDFSFDRLNRFTATTALVINDINALRASIFFTGSAEAIIAAAGDIVIDALHAPFADAELVAVHLDRYFDVIIRNAQEVVVGGTFFINARNIVFEFSDGGPADLDRLNIGSSFFEPHGEGAISVRSSLPIPEPTSLALLVVGLAGFGVAGGCKHR